MTPGGWLRSTLIEFACVAALVTVAASYAGHHTPVAAQQAGVWNLVYERPIAGKYEDFAFPTPKDGWLAAATGDIIHTADGGVTWAVQASGKGRLRSIDFLDARRGFAGTLTGNLYATTDGGDSWTEITSTLPRPAKGFCGITHVGNHVHVVGKYTGNAADYFFSPDGGKTWRGQDLRSMAHGLVDVSFLNDSVGFIGGMSNNGPVENGPAVILKTTDGGEHWHTVFTHDGGRGFAWKIFPVTSKLIYASLQSQDGTYRIAKSIDGGDKWEVLTVATGRNMGPAVQGIGFIDENTGWVGGFFQGLYGTTDGGHTWAPVQIQGATVNRFEKINGHTMFTAGTRGILRYDAVPTESAPAASPPQSDNCKVIPATARIGEIGAFSNVRLTAEHQYGETVMLWRAGSCLFGLLSHAEGLQADTPLGEITDIKFNDKTGAISFAARVAAGVIMVSDKRERGRYPFQFNGRLERTELTGVMSQDLEGTSVGNIMSKPERVVLKASTRDNEAMRGPATYAEWQSKWRPIIAARAAKK